MNCQSNKNNFLAERIERVFLGRDPPLLIYFVKDYNNFRNFMRRWCYYSEHTCHMYLTFDLSILQTCIINAKWVKHTLGIVLSIEEVSKGLHDKKRIRMSNKGKNGLRLMDNNYTSTSTIAEINHRRKLISSFFSESKQWMTFVIFPVV